MINSKKGQEMSVNVVVGLILGIMMLAAAMFLFFRIMDKTNKASDQVDEATKAKILQAFNSGEAVYAPVSNVEVKKGSAKFWIGIKNIGGGANNFKIEVTPLNPVVNFDKSMIKYIEGPYNINAKESEMPNVLVNMKGVTSKVSLLVQVYSAYGAEYRNYGNPKIVYIQP